MTDKSRIVSHPLPAACFVAGLCGLFTLAGASSGRLDVTVLLPVVLGVLGLFLTHADRHYQGPPHLLRAFGICGLLQMPVLPLLASTTQSSLVLSGLLPGLVSIALVALFCCVALFSRKSARGAGA